MLKINPLEKTQYFTHLSSLKNSQNTDIKQQRNDKEFYSGIPASYISFKANIPDNIKFDSGAVDLIKRAEEIAKEHNHSEITPAHIIAASIAKTLEKLNNLEEKDLINSSEPVSALNLLANKTANKNLLLNNDDLQLFIYSIIELQLENTQYLNNLQTKEIPKQNTNLSLENNFKTYLKNLDERAGKIDEYMLLGASFNVLTDNAESYPSNFLNKFLSLGYYKNKDDVMDNYMKIYDSRALDVWNKLALGSNLYITYNEKKEAQRIDASLLKTINASKHGNFNSKNTVIYSMTDSLTPQELLNEVHKKNEEFPDKQKIFTINLDNILFNVINSNQEEQIFPQ